MMELHVVLLYSIGIGRGGIIVVNIFYAFHICPLLFVYSNIFKYILVV